MGTNQVRLKVCNTKGKTIIAHTESVKGMVKIIIPFIEEVKKDNPKFAVNGVISYEVPQPKYLEAKKMITKYLEDLFLKELKGPVKNGEIIHSVHGSDSNTGRTQKKSKSSSV